MPIGLTAAIVGSSIAAGGGIGAALIGKKSASNAAKAQQQLTQPLINAQADASKWALDQAKIDIPKARETLGGPLAFWNKILSGDRNAAMSVAGPSADQLAGQTAAANRTQAEFAPRGGRRTLMLGDQPLSTTTSLNQGLLSLRPTAAGETKSIGQILAQLGLGEVNAGTSANASAISGQLASNAQATQSAEQSGAVLKDLGGNIGNILRLMIQSKSGGGGPATPGFPNIVMPPVTIPGIGSDPTAGR